MSKMHSSTVTFHRELFKENTISLRKIHLLEQNLEREVHIANNNNKKRKHLLMQRICVPVQMHQVNYE